mgnify:CR=1 FL=1
MVSPIWRLVTSCRIKASSSFVMSWVECILGLSVLGSSRTCGHSSLMRCVGGSAVLSFYRLNNWVIQVDNQLLVDGVFVRRLRFIHLSVISSSLSSSLEWSYSICLINRSILVIRLNCAVVNWVFRNSRSVHEVIQHLSAFLQLFGSDWCSLVQVLFCCWWVGNCWSKELFSVDSLICNNLDWLFNVSAHSHFLFEVNFGKGIVFLSVLDLFVSFVYEMITSSNVVMSVILNTLNSILRVKLKFIQKTIEQFFLHRHLLFSWKQSHVSVSVLHLKRPCVAANVVNSVSSIWISIKYSFDEILALTR